MVASGTIKIDGERSSSSFYVRDSVFRVFDCRLFGEAASAMYSSYLSDRSNSCKSLSVMQKEFDY